MTLYICSGVETRVAPGANVYMLGCVIGCVHYE